MVLSNQNYSYHRVRHETGYTILGLLWGVLGLVLLGTNIYTMVTTP